MSGSYHVRFVDVGREKRTWAARVRSGPALLREVMQHGRLLSRNIDVVYDPGEGRGVVLVGGVRVVGRIEAVAAPGEAG